MKRVLASAFAIVALSGAGLVTSASSVSAAPQGASALSCSKVFDDGNTAGIKCTGGAFIGYAKCANGAIAQGAAAASGTTSYAYCTSFNSHLASPRRWGGIPA
ncbi:hypothetical protein [Streptomyces triculaminicus]|uniref:hypothetical protein n=1 Tax=Streptomyces triculaminicus TaxID=2816232 RepID=UPI0037D875BF